MKKVVRLTRHNPEPAQIAALQAAFGQDLEIETISETLPASPKEAVARFDEITKGADAAEVVLPINLIEAVLKFSNFARRGGILLRAVMNRHVDEEGNATFTFDHYEVVKKVEVVTEPL